MKIFGLLAPKVQTFNEVTLFRLVSCSLTSLFGTNMAIAETNFSGYIGPLYIGYCLKVSILY